MTTTSAARKDIYSRITDKIIADLENNLRPWIKPWNAEHAAGCISRPLRHNGKPYSGINVLVLWAAAEEKSYSAPLWLTYNQAQKLKGQVRKGEKGEVVVYASTFTKTETDEVTGEESEREIPYLKTYRVFNADQIDGLDPHYYELADPTLDPTQRIEKAEAFFKATGANISYGGNRAYYAIESDRIQMPNFESFKSPEDYYCTLGHECAHWTRHQSRLNRDFGRKAWGDEGYAQEELVAEIASAFVSADLGLSLEPRDDHTSYIASWLEILKRDKKFIFTAAAHAQRAVDYLHTLQPSSEDQAA